MRRRRTRVAIANLSTASKTIEGEDGTANIFRPLDKKLRIDTLFEIYMGLYQAITAQSSGAAAAGLVILLVLRLQTRAFAAAQKL
jgi:hypothetical protein